MNVKRNKACLVTKCYTQNEGVGFKESFSPVSLKDSFRTIVALVAQYDLELHKMDVKTVFLNGNIDETTYMVQPENCVRRLKEYGLQFDRIHLWAKINISSMVPQISSSILSFGFEMDVVDDCVYHKFSESKFNLVSINAK